MGETKVEIIINLKGKSFALKLDEAKELFATLKDIFESKSRIEFEFPDFKKELLDDINSMGIIRNAIIDAVEK